MIQGLKIFSCDASLTTLKMMDSLADRPLAFLTYFDVILPILTYLTYIGLHVQILTFWDLFGTIFRCVAIFSNLNLIDSHAFSQTGSYFDIY